MDLESQESIDLDDAGQCLCGRPSTEGGAEDENFGLQIECDICRVWYHVRCVGLGLVGANAIDKYHCPRCESMCGASLMKARTNSHRHDCTDPDARTKATQVGTQDFIEELQRRTFPDALEHDVVAVINGSQLTLPYLNQTGFRNPILVDDPEGLGLTVPTPDFQISDVTKNLGHDLQVDVIDVHTQDTRLMSLSTFCSSFDIPLEDRAMSEVFNCTSLEVSDTQLGDLVEPPTVARKLCWVNNVWSQSFSGEVDMMPPPHVQKYCIMSMKDSFTDFHIDFGGTSVWYYIFKGEKIFYFIQPSATNLSLYERWLQLSSQSETFLGDMVDRCYRVRVKQGQTILIPTGWIHAVYTPRDSIIFGGHFLHSLNIQLQLRVFEIEERASIPKRREFPSFEAVNWLAAQKLKSDLSDLNSDSTLCPAHLLGGIKALSQTLKTWLQDLDSRPCPTSIDPHYLVRELAKEVRLAERISNKCNPPKPERESKRKKQKKQLNSDFIDISHGSALFLLTGRSTQKKRPPAKSKLLAAELTTTVQEPFDMEDMSVGPTPKPKAPSRKKQPVKKTDLGRKIKLKLPTKERLNSGHNLGMNEDSFDLTDEDFHAHASNSHNQLHFALGAALASFGDKKQLIIDESPRHKASSASLKLKLNVAKQSKQAALEDMKMTKVHQDDDYIYPSLELSDDEMDIGPTVTVAKDELWNPRVRVKSVGKKSEPRPSRDGAKKVAAIEKGLKVASEKRRSKISSTLQSKSSPSPTKKKLVARTKEDAQPLPRKSYLLSSEMRPGLTKLKSFQENPITTSEIKRSKKGMLTAKQRIAKTLGLKF